MQICSIPTLISEYKYIFIILGIVVSFLVIILLYKIIFKRLFDIIISALGLIILSPLLLILAVLIRKKLGSPVIFDQYRPGRNNKIFKLHKFRTMTMERDENGKLLPDEVRLTKFGRFLRSTSLDELPELWDIFRGKMSLIGPRPQLVKDLVFMDDETKKRHKVRPGLTGLAQVNGRNIGDWDKRFEYDLRYVKKLNIFLDIAIFFRTIFIIFKRSNIATEGMATSQDYGDYLLEQDRITQDEYVSNQEVAATMLK